MRAAVRERKEGGKKEQRERVCWGKREKWRKG